MAIYNNLQVNYDGTIFQYSKEPKEGFEEFKNTKGKISYRKYFKYGVDGIFSGLKKENNQFLNGAEELKLTLKEGEDTYNILAFTVLNQDGNQLDDFTESIVTKLANMELGVEYNINNWYMKKGDTVNGEIVKYSNKGVTVKEGENKIKSSVTYEYIKNRGSDAETHVPGDVPMLQWTIIAGKNRPTAASKEAQLVFLYELMDKQINRLGRAESTTTQESPKAKEIPPVNNQSKEDLDLPF